MMNLRLVLLIIGLLLIAAIYYWGSKRLRREQTAAHGNGKNGEKPARTDTAPSVVMLFLYASNDYHYRGEDILEATRTVGMELGGQGFFQHTGVGFLQAGKPLFSIANMMKPGGFDLDTIHEVETPGLALFMPLPSPVENGLALELLLGTAYALQNKLGGNLLNDKREPLSQEDIKRLRELIAHG